LYKPEVISSIGQLLGISDSKRLDELGVYLCRATAPYLMVMQDAADDAGLELKRSDRMKWLDDHFIEPARKLIDALDHANDRRHSEWPNTEIQWIDRPLPSPQSWLASWRKRGKKLQRSGQSHRALGHPTTYREIWLSELNRLANWAETKKAALGQREAGTQKSSTKLRHELVYDLLLVYVTLFPNRRPTRASHGAGEKRAQQSKIQSKFAEFVRAAASPALGRYENLDHQIQKAIERYRAEKTELWMRPHFFI
jgi:hypothetical protein